MGVKDIFDTAALPTSYGSPIYRDWRPRRDAAVVRRMQDAGLVILGKTVTTEFASWTPGETRNPRDLTRTPGGSSSGSAAAVADAMVPLAIGTQTVGSTIRPASYCGVVGFKPTYGAVALTGAFQQSPSQDTVGLFGTSIDDVRCLATVLGIDAGGVDVAHLDPPRLGFIRTPWWGRLDPASRARIEAVVESIAAAGAEIVEVDLCRTPFEGIIEAQQVVTEREGAVSLAGEFGRHEELLSERLRAMCERGARTSDAAYGAAFAVRNACHRHLTRAWEGLDAAIMPAADEAPAGLESTGDPTFVRPWSLLGYPALTLPAAIGRHGMPVGIQLVGMRGTDAGTLATGAWVERSLSGAPSIGSGY